jgi:hypothetical protein
MPTPPDITFVLIDHEPLERLEKLDPDRNWSDFITGERAWVLQTFLRLRAAGISVRLASQLPPHGIAVFSSKQRRLLRHRDEGRTAAVLIGIREDVGEALIADFEVVQNPVQADGQRRFFIPFWPQPGLLPREPARGARIETLAYKGFLGNLHPEFADAAWRNVLDSNGLKWWTDAAVYHGPEAASAQVETLAWNDYRQVDLILAVRPPDADLHPRKPATKLYNAWHAGVPALLGPESAYRALRTSELDYIEIRNRSEAEAAIRDLRAQPQRYLDMIESGRRRALEFGRDRVVEQWRRLLHDELPKRADASHVHRWRNKPLWLKEGCRRVTRALKL